MASIIKTSIDLTKIPKDKIIEGKKGKYLPITITLNDEVDQFGNNGPVVVAQSKEEREAKVEKVYLICFLYSAINTHFFGLNFKPCKIMNISFFTFHRNIPRFL